MLDGNLGAHNGALLASGLIGAVIVLRLPEIVGVGLIAIFVPHPLASARPRDLRPRVEAVGRSSYRFGLLCSKSVIFVMAGPDTTAGESRRPHSLAGVGLRRRIGGLVAVLALGLAGCAGGGPHPAGIHAAPTSTPATPSTSATPATTTSVPPGNTVYAVTPAQITVTATTGAGGTVDIPTRLWMPDIEKGARVPLVVFSPGYQIDPSRYDVLTTAWAAAGYVVAEPQYPDTSLGSPPIEDDIVHHPTELSQVITTLTSDRGVAGLITPGKVALVGQSDGGDVSLATAYNTCCRDPRIGAVISLSGAEWTIFGGAYFTAGGPPILVVQGDKDAINVPACSSQLFNAAPEPRFYFDIPDATHLSPYTAPVGPQVTAVRQVTIAFLDGYLKGMTPKVLELQHLGNALGVGRMIEGPATVPVNGACPGAPVQG